MKYFLGIINLLLFSFSSGATVRSGLCPQEFIGRFKVILESVGDLKKEYETHHLVFTNLETLRGEVSEEVILEVLKFGPFQLKEDHDYRIQINKGRLCWLEEVDYKP